MHNRYKHIFFDLDRTLWDFEANSSRTIYRLFDEKGLEEILGVGKQEFLNAYKLNNHKLWDDYRKGMVSKNELRLQRYHQTFLEFGLDDEEEALKFNNDYVVSCSKEKTLISGAVEVLEYLSPNYKLHIITNGFIEAQQTKLIHSGIEKYFDQVIVSDGFGYRKPDSRIFEYAMNQAKSKSENSLMIGDDYGPDVIGARNVGMDQIYFCNKENIKEATFVIHSLIELKEIL